MAAYVRVSKESERLAHSFSAQVSYYNRLIASTPGWVFAGVYSDYATTGTTAAKRQEFNDMIAAACAGEIDIILTKSISRFARNTVDLLATCRELKNAGVEVWFERENIHTASVEGEILLTLLASFAQAESESISQNAKWGIRKKYAQGRIHSCHPYGYRYVCDHPAIIDPEIFARVQTEFVRRRASDGCALTPGGRNNALTHHLECTVCHAHYQRRTKKKTTKTVKYWWCETATKGKGNPCRAHQLEETRLKNLTKRVLGIQEWDDETVLGLLENIVVDPDYRLTFLLKDGTTRSVNYRDGGAVSE